MTRESHHVRKACAYTKQTLTFTYDNLHRLTSASTTLASSTPYAYSYTYTPIGNISSSTPSGAFTYAETSYTNPNAPTAINGTTLTYDTNGNLTKRGTSYYSWNYTNQMTGAGNGSATTTYGYDHTGQRVFKVTPSSATTAYANDYYDTDGTTKTKHIYAGGELVATITTVGATSTTQYLHTDHLGSVTAASNASGSVVEATDFYPYGSERYASGSFEEQRKYIGQEYDTESSLSYLNARYYEGLRGQFISQDPTFWGVQNLANPQSMNSYNYANGNPITLKDPTGLAVSEYQPYIPSDGSYDIRDPIGSYRGVNITSGGDSTGTYVSAFQCTDFAVSFAKNQFGINLSGTGNGVDYGSQTNVSRAFSANNSSNPGSYRVYGNSGSTMPQENDLISWSGNGAGHVGVIAEVVFDDESGTGRVYSLEQNYKRGQGLYSQSLTRTYDKDGRAVYTVSGRGKYSVKGWARYENQSRVPGKEKYTKTRHTPAPKTPIRRKI